MAYNLTPENQSIVPCGLRRLWSDSALALSDQSHRSPHGIAQYTSLFLLTDCLQSRDGLLPNTGRTRQRTCFLVRRLKSQDFYETYIQYDSMVLNNSPIPNGSESKRYQWISGLIHIPLWTSYSTVLPVSIVNKFSRMSHCSDILIFRGASFPRKSRK